jgi:hypothetical protein
VDRNQYDPRMRRWPRFALVVAAVAAVVCAAPAGATTTTKQPTPVKINSLAKRLVNGPSYVSPGLRDNVDEAALQRAALKHPGYRLVVLNALLTGTETAELAAKAILAKLADAEPPVTFVAVAHVTDQGVDLGGAMSGDTANAELIAEHADVAEKAGDASVIDTLTRFTDGVASGEFPEASASAPGSGDTAGGGGGRSLFFWLALLAVVALAVLGVLRMRAVSRERRRRARVGSIGTARTFHIARLDALSLRHSQLVRDVAERPDEPALADHHGTAGATLVALRRQLPGLFSPRELRTCAGQLDEIEWHIESAEALVSGHALPPRPSGAHPGLCFFTYEHGLGTVEVEVKRPDGTAVAVWVCPANAVALTRGEELLVSRVHVGSRLVPWPAAPTYYGAAGWAAEDLPGLEYEGREIWGRDVPDRDDAPDLPYDTVPGAIPAAAIQPVGVQTPLPPGVTPPPLIDEDGLPPGVSTPPPIDADDGLGEPFFEELEEAPPSALVRGAPADLTDEITAEHLPVDADATQAYDPFKGDDEPAPWETDPDDPR